MRERTQRFASQSCEWFALFGFSSQAYDSRTGRAKDTECFFSSKPRPWSAFIAGVDYRHLVKRLATTSLITYIGLEAKVDYDPLNTIGALGGGKVLYVDNNTGPSIYGPVLEEHVRSSASEVGFMLID